MSSPNLSDSERLIKIETLLEELTTNSKWQLKDHENRLRGLEDLKDHIKKVPDLEKRVSQLERMVWIASGAAATGGGFVGAIAPALIGM